MESAENTFSMEQVLQMFAAMNKQNQENLLEAIKELKKPSPEEQAKLDKEKAKLQERALAAVKLAMSEEKAKENAARYCPHGTTHHGTKAFTHQWRAQVMSPFGEKPYYIPRCTQCGSTWDRWVGASSPKILATPEQQKEGVNLDQYGQNDIDRLFAWAKEHPVEELQPA